MNFRSKEELYERIHPALLNKVREFKRKGIDYIKEEDIWNFLIEKKWRHEKGLNLFNVVSDVLSLDENVIKDYLHEKIKNKDRVTYFS